MPQMSAAPYPVKLGGLELRMSPLQDRDYDELSNWMRAKVVSTARACLTDDMDPEERRELIGAAVDTASRMQFGDPAHMSYFRSVDGIARMYWKGLVHNHPNLTVEKVKELLTNDSDGIAECSRVFVELNFQKKRTDAGGQTGANPGASAEPSPEQGANLLGNY